MLDNLLFFQFSSIKNVHCLFHGKNNNTQKSLGSIAFGRGEDDTVILKNRKYLFEKLHIPVLEVHQIHSSILHFSPAETLYSEKASLEGDGIATDKAKHALLIKTADCQPVLFTDKQGEHIMALHVGWRGSRNDFIAQAVAEFCEKYKIPAGDLSAVRGPSLGPSEAEFTNFADEWGDAYKNWYNAQMQTLNLWELTRFQLKQAGLLPENIYGIDFCTKTMHNQYFSHRENNQTGRQASIIWFE